MSTSGEHLPAPETAARPNNHMREITAFLKAGKWSFEGSSEAGHCKAMGSGPVSVAAFTRALSSELDAMGIIDEVIRGQYLRASIFGDARNEMLQKIDAVPALAARVRNGSASFSDYASALYACIPVGAEAGFIDQACSFRRGFRERLFDALHRFERILHDLGALGLSVPHDLQFWVLYRNLSLEERGLLSNVSGVAERLGRPWDETPDACAERHAFLYSSLRNFCLTPPHSASVPHSFDRDVSGFQRGGSGGVGSGHASRGAGSSGSAAPGGGSGRGGGGGNGGGGGGGSCGSGGSGGGSGGSNGDSDSSMNSH